MKLKSLAVITLLVVACGFASAQTFGFASTGSALYCNYEQLTGGWIGPDVYGGIDNLSVCGANSGTIAGFAASIPAATKSGLPSGGAGVVYGDNLYDAEYAYYTGAQWTVWSKLKCNKANKKTGLFTGAYSWIGIAGVSGEIFGDNYGYLSCTLPDLRHGDAGRPSTAGKASTARQTLKKR